MGNRVLQNAQIVALKNERKRGMDYYSNSDTEKGMLTVVNYSLIDLIALRFVLRENRDELTIDNFVS